MESKDLEWEVTISSIGLESERNGNESKVYFNIYRNAFVGYCYGIILDFRMHIRNLLGNNVELFYNESGKAQDWMRST